MRPVHAVIVAFHGPESVNLALSGICGLPVTVVDNSGAAEVAQVANEHEAEYVNPGLNLGFARGVNVALRRVMQGPAADVLLLNPDAVIERSELEKLSRFLHAPDGARRGAVAPRLVDLDGGPQRTLWPFPSPARAWLEAVGLGRLPARELFAVGAVLLLRWEAVQEVGLFDERFFLYAEEADWQQRARRLRWRTELCQEAVAAHVGGGTSSDPVRREILFHAAQETYVRKWFGLAGWWTYRSAAVVGASARAIVLRRERRRAAARRAMLYARGPRRAV